MNLDREDFRQWLASKEPDEPVGTESDCPGDRWFSEGLGVEAIMGCFYVHLPFSGKPISAPDWLRRFAAAVDDKHDPMGPDGWGNVTAKEALTILDSVEL